MAKVLSTQQNYIRLLDGAGNTINATSNALDVNFATDVTSATATNFKSQVSNAGTFATQIDGTALTHLAAVAGAVSGTEVQCDIVSLPMLSAGTNNIGDVDIATVPVVGSQGNASTVHLTVGSDEASTFSIDCQYVSKLSVFGSIDQACTVTLQQSQNDLTFYDTGLSYIGGGAENFYMSLDNAGARYYQLVYSTNGTTITATIAGKN
jgi:hypothetical protein